MLNTENFIATIEDSIKQHKRVVVRNRRNDECQSTLQAVGFNLHIYWELAYKVAGTDTTLVPCICLNDGYISYFSVSHLRNGRVRCNGCRVDKYKKFAEANDLIYIAHRANGTTCLVKTKCKVDGHIREISSSELFVNKLTCPVCYENEIKSLSVNLGFNFLALIRNSGDKTRVLLQCPHDNYFRSVSTTEVYSQKLMCRICQVKGYSDSLSTKGCKYIRHYTEAKGSRVTTYVEYSTPSGLTLRAIASNLNRNKFAITDDTHWNQQHSVYCIRTTDSATGLEYIKIGTANFPEIRLLEFKLLYPATTETLASFDNRGDANKLEKYLHKLLKEHKASPLEVDHMIGKIIKAKLKGNSLSTKDGCTEWFKGSALKELEGLDYSSFK